MIAMSRDITVKFEDGTTHVYKGAPDDITPEQVTQRAEKEFGKRIEALDGGADKMQAQPKGEEPGALDRAWDWLKGGLDENRRIFDTTVRGGALAIPGALGDVGAIGVEKLTENLGHPYKFDMMPSEALERMTGGPIQRPKTTVGKYMGSMGQDAVASAIPFGRLPYSFKSLLAPATVGAASGLGAEAADQAAGGDNPLARMTGGLVGGGLMALTSARTPNARRLLRASMKGVDEDDWRKARELEDTLLENDIPHLKSGLVGENSMLDDVVAAAGTHPTARPRLLKAVKGMDTQAKKSVDRWLTENFATGAAGSRGTLADVQEAADNYLKQLRRTSTLAYRDALPEGLEESVYAPSYVKAIQRDLLDRAKDPDVGPNSAMGQLLNRVAQQLEPFKETVKVGTKRVPKVVKQPMGNRTVNRLASETQDLVQERLLPTPKGHVNRILMEMNDLPEAEGVRGFANETSKRMLRDYTPEFQPARDAMSSHIDNVVNPAKKGLVGDIANVGGGVRPDKMTAGDQIFRIVFNSNRPQGTEIRKLTKQIGPDNMGELLREHIIQNANRVFKKTSAAGTLDQPAKFSQAITGTAAQRENLRAAIEAVAPHYKIDGKAASHGFNRLVRALDSTHFMQLPSSIDRSALGQQLGESATSLVVAPHSRVGRWFTENARSRAVNQIADLVTDPDGLRKLERLAKTEEPSAAAALARALVADSINQAKQDEPPAELTAE